LDDLKLWRLLCLEFLFLNFDFEDLGLGSMLFKLLCYTKPGGLFGILGLL
jgi:hypothetical protein